MSQYTIRPVEIHEWDTWDELVRSSPGGTLYHTSSWKRLVDEAYAPAFGSLVGIFTRDRLVGGCAFLDRSRMGLQTAVTPLMAAYSGFFLEESSSEKLSDQVSKQAELFAELAGFLGATYSYENFHLSPATLDGRPLAAQGYSLTPRYTYELNLSLPAQDLWLRMDGHVRRQVKKAERADLEITGTLPLDQAYELFKGTFGKRGQECPVPEKLFYSVVAGHAIADQRQHYCALLAGELVSFITLLRHERQFYYAVSSTAEHALSTGVSSLLIWEILQEHAGHGNGVLDFVGANIQTIARFKEGFNPELRLYLQVERCKNPALKVGKKLSRLLRS